MPPKQGKVAYWWQKDVDGIEQLAEKHINEVVESKANKHQELLYKKVCSLLEEIVGEGAIRSDAGEAVAGEGGWKPTYTPTIILLSNSALAAIYHVTKGLSGLAGVAPGGIFRMWMSEGVLQEIGTLRVALPERPPPRTDSNAQHPPPPTDDGATVAEENYLLLWAQVRGDRLLWPDDGIKSPVSCLTRVYVHNAKDAW
ncbi:hypothetical protein QIS74_06609 [Colletotrichum tabaci]|uniref:Uncharacterized protein n=1 Tax=Colletotrichum tabaci TaxID=1209068 RepID=A0AAV9TC55_9PEZI